MADYLILYLKQNDGLISRRETTLIINVRYPPSQVAINADKHLKKFSVFSPSFVDYNNSLK